MTSWSSIFNKIVSVSQFLYYIFNILFFEKEDF